MDEQNAKFFELVDEQGPILDGRKAEALQSSWAAGEEDLDWALELLQQPLRPLVEQIATDQEIAQEAAEQLVATAEYIEALDGILACLKATESRLALALCVREDKDQLISAARTKIGLSRTQ